MRSALLAAALILCGSTTAWADAGSSYTLAQVETPLPVPAVSYYAPTVVGYAPPVSYAPPVGYAAQVSYYAPGYAGASTYAAAPVTSYYAPTYAPVAPAPTVVYRPLVSAPVYPAPVYVGRPAVVRQHLYIRGQPVRNALRVLLP